MKVPKLTAYYLLYILIADSFQHLFNKKMASNIFTANSTTGKVASDLAIGSVLSSTSKFVKGVQSSEEQNISGMQRYGSSQRRMINRKNKPLPEQKQQDGDTGSEKTQDLKNRKFQREGQTDRLPRKIINQSANTKSTTNLVNQNVETPRGSEVSTKKGFLSRRKDDSQQIPSQPEVKKERPGYAANRMKAPLNLQEETPKKQQIIQPVPRYGANRRSTPIANKQQSSDIHLIQPPKPANRYGRRPVVQNTTLAEVDPFTDRSSQIKQTSYGRRAQPSTISVEETPKNQQAQPRYGRKPQVQKVIQKEELKQKQELIEPDNKPKISETKTVNRYGRSSQPITPEVQKKKEDIAPPRYGRKSELQNPLKPELQQKQTFQAIPNTMLDGLINPSKTKRQGRYGQNRTPTPRSPNQTKKQQETKPSPVNRYGKKIQPSKKNQIEPENPVAGQEAEEIQEQKHKKVDNTSSQVTTRGVRSNTLQSKTNPSQITQSNVKESLQSQVKVQERKKSLLVAYLLAALGKKKLNNYFQDFRNSTQQKKKNLTFFKALSYQLSELFSRKKEQYVIDAYNLIINPRPQAQKSIIKPKGVKKVITNLQRLAQFLPNMLNMVQKRKMKESFDKIQHYYKKRYSHHLNNCLDRLFRNKINKAFLEFKNIIQITKNYQSINVNCVVSISSKAHQQTKAVFLLKLFNNAIDKQPISTIENKEQIEDFSPIRGGVSEVSESPQNQNKILNQLSKQCEEHEKLIRQLGQANQNDSLEAKDKLQMAKIACREITQHIEYKKKHNEALKTKIQSITIPQQNYIDEDQPLSQTKFPLLTEVYVKVQKIGSQIAISELKDSFPFLAEEFTDNLLAQQWDSFLTSFGVRKQIEQYEGVEMMERRAAKVIQQQILGLENIVRGYVKEKYAWEWVRSAISNVSVVSV